MLTFGSERDSARDDSSGAHWGRKQLQGFNDRADRPRPILNIFTTGPPEISGRNKWEDGAGGGRSPSASVPVHPLHCHHTALARVLAPRSV